jgi:hypothetical protein
LRTFQNTFEILGDPCPYRAANEREYAESMLEFFTLRGKSGYFVNCPEPRATGDAEEIEWARRLWERATPTSDEEKSQIDRETLLDFLEETVKEVDSDCLPTVYDEQDWWDQEVPEEYKEHLWKAFAHKAGQGLDPGEYCAPEVPPYDPFAQR